MQSSDGLSIHNKGQMAKTFNSLLSFQKKDIHIGTNNYSITLLMKLKNERAFSG